RLLSTTSTIPSWQCGSPLECKKSTWSVGRPMTALTASLPTVTSGDSRRLVASSLRSRTHSRRTDLPRRLLVLEKDAVALTSNLREVNQGCLLGHELKAMP